MITTNSIETFRKRIKPRDKMKMKALIFYCVMFALPLIQFGIFYIGVNFNSILLAFKEYTVVGRSVTTVWVGFKNFEKFFNEFKMPGMWEMVGNSFIVCGVGIFITIPLNLIFSYFIYKKFRGSQFFQIMLFLPTILSEMVLVVLFKTLIEQVFPNVFHLPFYFDFSSEGSPFFIICLCFSTVINFGSTTLVYANAMSGVPTSLIESSEIDGAGSLRQFFSVVIPCIWPTIVSYIVLAFVGLTTNQVSLYSFFSNNLEQVPLDQKTLAAWSYQRLMSNSASQENYPFVSAIGLFLTLIVAPLSMVVNHLLTKYGPSEK